MSRVKAKKFRCSQRNLDPRLSPRERLAAGTRRSEKCVFGFRYISPDFFVMQDRTRPPNKKRLLSLLRPMNLVPF